MEKEPENAQPATGAVMCVLARPLKSSCFPRTLAYAWMPSPIFHYTRSPSHLLSFTVPHSMPPTRPSRSPRYSAPKPFFNLRRVPKPLPRAPGKYVPPLCRCGYKTLTYLSPTRPQGQQGQAGASRAPRAGHARLFLRHGHVAGRQSTSTPSTMRARPDTDLFARPRMPSTSASRHRTST